MLCGRKCWQCSRNSCPLRTEPSEDIFAETSSLTNTETDIRALCIDVGTTTIACRLTAPGVSLTKTAVNRQRVFGADIISRIERSVGLGALQLTSSIRSQLRALAEEIIQESDCKGVDLVIICGNTAMVHFLIGWDTSGLGQYPFSPHSLSSVKTDCRTLLQLDTDAPAVILPGISAFVGGDIVSGLLYLDFDRRQDCCLLMDLGTNGELALKTPAGIFTASTAAGPSFEGGNISCGCPAIPGAISGWDMDTGIISTVGGAKPCGICGSGIVEVIAELLEHSIVDRNGLLRGEYFETGYPLYENIVLTQNDIRQFQLAKAAVRSGTDILLQKAGLAYNDISCIYISGGLGNYLKKAPAVGLIPPGIPFYPAGNSALGGLLKFAADPKAETRIQQLISLARPVELAMEPGFETEYLKAMELSDK